MHFGAPSRAIILLASLFALLCGTSESRASFDCEAQFRSFDSSVLAHLPEQMRNEFSFLRPKIKSRFEARYFKRDRVRAAAEAERLIAKTLLGKDTDLKITPMLLGRESRVRSVSELLTNRLEHSLLREQLEKRLIEIGYKQDSSYAQEWSSFRARHFRSLESIKRFAINSTSTMVFGLPLFLRPFQYQRFQLTQNRGQMFSTDWAQVEMVIRQRIESRDPDLMREIKTEVAIEVVRRIVALGVLAILTDEFLEFVYPEWTPFKQNTWNSVWSETSVESKAELEKIAMTNWLDIAELLSGVRPLPSSPEYKEIAGRLTKMSHNELSAHVHNGAPLIDSPVEN